MRAHSIRDRLTRTSSLELWGGVECTVNRVGDRYFDQLARTGHFTRLDDLDRFAELGIRTLRFPLLWEHVQPDPDREPDWRWADASLERLRELGVRTTVGLLHHGFGPGWVDARDPEFAMHFARYAAMVAERYPWIDAYTPINEPLTTARFSGLYGHWYPHARDDASFVRLLLAQLSATVHAMHSIRCVNSEAMLVQTEDLGKVASTPALESQRDFENERRWLTWDALSGKLTREHGCWSYLSSHATEYELDAFADAPCPPDVIGINHYVTSERFLDEHVERYALDEIGGNGREVYADVAQVQVPSIVRAGIAGLIRETWERYHAPIAITECHIGCTREEQMRWLHEVWLAAEGARRDGVDLRAVTSWALLGSYDWDSLVTRAQGHYESGAFDVRTQSPRPTALGAMLTALAHDGSFEHPVLATPGWWHRRPGSEAHGQPLLIVADDERAAASLTDACAVRGLSYVIVDRAASEIALDRSRPWGVVSVEESGIAIADECARRTIPFVIFESRTRDANATLDQLLDASCDAASSLELAAI